MCNCEKDDKCTCQCCRSGAKMLYANVALDVDHIALMSANEVGLLDKMADLLANDEKDITFDESAENDAPKIVYGGVMINTLSYDFAEVQKLLNVNRGRAFASLDDFDGKTVVLSTLDDFVFGDLSKAVGEVFYPFAALMHTKTVLHDSDTSVTFFPFTDLGVTLSMTNKAFLVACRKTVEIDGLNLDNWKEYIDNDLLMKCFKIADKYTGDDSEAIVFEHK